MAMASLPPLLRLGSSERHRFCGRDWAVAVVYEPQQDDIKKPRYVTLWVSRMAGPPCSAVYLKAGHVVRLERRGVHRALASLKPATLDWFALEVLLAAGGGKGRIRIKCLSAAEHVDAAASMFPHALIAGIDFVSDPDLPMFPGSTGQFALGALQGQKPPTWASDLAARIRVAIQANSDDLCSCLDSFDHAVCRIQAPEYGILIRSWVDKPTGPVATLEHIANVLKLPGMAIKLKSIACQRVLPQFFQGDDWTLHLAACHEFWTKAADDDDLVQPLLFELGKQAGALRPRVESAHPILQQILALASGPPLGDGGKRVLEVLRDAAERAVRVGGDRVEPVVPLFQDLAAAGLLFPRLQRKAMTDIWKAYPSAGWRMRGALLRARADLGTLDEALAGGPLEMRSALQAGDDAFVASSRIVYRDNGRAFMELLPFVARGGRGRQARQLATLVRGAAAARVLFRYDFLVPLLVLGSKTGAPEFGQLLLDAVWKHVAEKRNFRSSALRFVVQSVSDSGLNLDLGMARTWSMGANAYLAACDAVFGPANAKQLAELVCEIVLLRKASVKQEVACALHGASLAGILSRPDCLEGLCLMVRGVCPPEGERIVLEALWSQEVLGTSVFRSGAKRRVEAAMVSAKARFSPNDFVDLLPAPHSRRSALRKRAFLALDAVLLAIAVWLLVAYLMTPAS